VTGTSSLNKAAREEGRKGLRNRMDRGSIKTRMTAAGKAIHKGEKEEALQAAQEAVKCIDRVVQKGVFHRNKGARLKARLMRKLNAKV